MSTTTTTPAPAANCSAFQRDLLVAIRDADRPSGADIQETLEQYYDEISNARLYDNLAVVVELGLATKGARDARADEYALTDEGEATLAADHAWRDADA